MNRTRGFTLLELFMLIVFAGPLMWILESPGSPFIHSERRKLDATRQRGIVMALLDYANDHEGTLPSQSAGGGSFTNSTDAFQYLIEYSDGLKEEHFYVPGNPTKRRAPNNDGKLLPEENRLAYVTGLNTSMPPDSPVTADEMESPGVYGANHPWLRDGYAVAGYLGGHVTREKLSQRRPGATVMGSPESGIKDIFQPRPAGLLAVPRENILLP